MRQIRDTVKLRLYLKEVRRGDGRKEKESQ